MPLEHRGGQPRRLRERRAEDEQVDDRILLAPDEPLAHGAVPLADPARPRRGQPIVREARQPGRQRLAHGLDDRPGFVERSETRSLSRRGQEDDEDAGQKGAQRGRPGMSGL